MAPSAFLLLFEISHVFLGRSHKNAFPMTQQILKAPALEVASALLDETHPKTSKFSLLIIGFQLRPVSAQVQHSDPGWLVDGEPLPVLAVATPANVFLAPMGKEHHNE